MNTFYQDTLTGTNSGTDSVLFRLMYSIFHTPNRWAMWHTRQLGHETSYYSHYFALMYNNGWTARARSGNRVNLTLTEAGKKALKTMANV